jgi:hypothetical protein
MVTFAPVGGKPMALAKALETSVIRSAEAGIRDATVAVVCWLLSLFVTRTWVPRGRLGWAMAKPGESKDWVAVPVCLKFRTDWAKRDGITKSDMRITKNADLFFIMPVLRIFPVLWVSSMNSLLPWQQAF